MAREKAQPKYKRKMIGVRMDDRLLDRIDAYGFDRHQPNRTGAILGLLAFALDYFESQKTQQSA